MKKLITMMIISVLSASLMACTPGDISLYDAVKNTQEVNAIENNTDISFNLSGQGLGKDETDQLKQISNIINSMRVNVKSKSYGNEEGTAVTAESDINIDFMGMNIPLNGWSQIDTETSKMITISKIPETALGIIGTRIESDEENPLAGKEYVVNDLGAIIQAEGEKIDFEEMLEFQKEFQPKLIKLMEKIEEDLKLDYKIIELQEEIEVNGEKIKKYRLKLDDESLRVFLKDLVDYGLENKDTRKFVLEYINEYIDTINNISMEDKVSQGDLKEVQEASEDLEDDLDQDVSIIKEKFNNFIEKYTDIKILGEDGINIIYSVDENGYVVEKDGLIDLSINLGLISEFKDEEEIEELIVKNEQFEKLFPSKQMKGRVNLKINFKSTNSNINSEDLVVTFPELTSKNSLTLEEMLEIQMQQIYK